MRRSRVKNRRGGGRGGRGGVGDRISIKKKRKKEAGRSRGKECEEEGLGKGM